MCCMSINRDSGTGIRDVDVRILILPLLNLKVHFVVNVKDIYQLCNYCGNTF
jgi:hypothetical protein